LHVERQTLTMRMQIRRLTRLTNAFGKRWEKLKAALALPLWITPAMEAGVSDHVWSFEELLQSVIFPLTSF